MSRLRAVHLHNLVDLLRHPARAVSAPDTPARLLGDRLDGSAGQFISGHSVVTTDRCADVGLSVDHCHV